MKTIVKIALLSMLICFSVSSCQRWQVTQMSASTTVIDAQFDAIQDTDYLQVLQPIKEALEKDMSVVIGSIDEDMTLDADNPTLLYFAANMLQDMACRKVETNPDFAVVNAGGIRCGGWSKGNVTIGDVFKMMPFDNRLVILTLKGEDVQDLFDRCAFLHQKGFSNEVKDLKIVPEAYYRIATSDYLSHGADRIFNEAATIAVEETGLIIRDLYLEWFTL